MSKFHLYHKRYKDKKNSFLGIYCGIVCVVAIMLSVGFAAFSNDLSIRDISAIVRINANIRITDITYINSTVGAYSNFVDRNVTNIHGTVTLPYEDSYIDYKMKITNIGNIEEGIVSFLGDNENLNYEFLDYNLGDKICETIGESKKCKLGIDKYIILRLSWVDGKYDSENTTQNFIYDVDFQFYNTVTIADDISTYITNIPPEVINKGTLRFNYSGPLNIIRIKVGGVEVTDYQLDNGVITLNNIEGPVVISYKNIELYSMIKNMSLGSSSKINFNVSSEYSETKGLEQAGVYQLDEDPNVYFYRGAVNNNVIFANFCWKIVRTTTTGGVKLIYNGIPISNKCSTQTGSGTTIGNSAFNTIINDPKYIGYMYNNNSTNSAIKTQIDNWYQKNMKNYSYALEDEVWCNDRSVVQYSSDLIGDYSGSSDYIFYGVSIRASFRSKKVNPTTTCLNAADKFTVSSANGNGKLIYPVGLITQDEQAMAGATSNWNSNGEKSASEYTNNTYYLNNNGYYWTMTPNIWISYYPYVGVGRVRNNFRMGDSSVSDSTIAIRPAVSLAPGANIIVTGEGTSSNPYVVVDE